MKYRSTRGGVEGLSFSDAVMMGLATDGGLIVPESIPNLRPSLSQFSSLSYPDLAFQIMQPFADDIDARAFEALVARSYAQFQHAEIAPLVPVGNVHVLELFHGPTLAFKDIALQFLGELFSHILAARGSELNILGATSGDTGSAAIAGVRGKPGIRIFIMFPEGRTSPIQERQMTTVLDDNVYNLSIDGSFDDCQNLLKTVFSDLEFKARFSLGAVNSVNFARVLAQTVYYFWSWTRLGCPEQFDVTVPTGNFGNIFAGFLAKKMGLPLRKLILATNQNDILARFFDSGVYQRGTVGFSNSPAMDIQVASNFERYLYYQLDEDSVACRTFMQDFQNQGRGILLDRSGAFDWFSAGSVSDQETIECLRSTWMDSDYLADPHTAVGLHLASRHLDTNIPMVCLATAHPAKFDAAVAEAVPGVTNSHPTLDRLQGQATRKVEIQDDPETLKDFIRAACQNGH